MASKSVTDRSKATELVVSALRTSVTSAVSKLDDAFQPLLRKGEKMPDWGLVFELLARATERTMVDARKADDVHTAELSDDAEPRQRRDEAAAEVRAELVDVRQAVVTLFGESWLGKLQLPSAIPVDPAALERVAGAFLDALGEAKLPKPRLRGVASFDAGAWHDALQAPLASLRKSLKEVAREVREAEVTLKEKNRALDAHDHTFARAAGLGAALLRWAGEDELADRLRPSARRPGTLVSGDDEPPAPSPTPPAPGE